MGNNQTKSSIEKTPIFEVIRQEFLSLKQIDNQKISFDQLSFFKIPKIYQGDIDLARLETVFVLDNDRDGLFSLDDIKSFCVLFSNMNESPEWDISHRFHSLCVDRLVHAIEQEGARKIAEWTLSLINCSSSAIPQESVMLLFRLFAPLTGDSMDGLKFYRLLKRSSGSVEKPTVLNSFLEPFFTCYLQFHKRG
jgi:hypothetical protein